MGSFGEGCGGLDENGPHRHIYLNAWYSFGGRIRPGIVGIDVLPEGGL